MPGILSSGPLRAVAAATCLFLSAAAGAPAAVQDEPAAAQEEPAAGTQPARTPLRIPRAESAIQVDGRLDEPAWQKALTIELTYEVWPGDNLEARVRTEGLLLYDDGSFYVAFRAHDPEPRRIRARLSDRDRAFQDDFVGVVLDTFNDERRAFEFFANPMGVQMDLIQDDVNGNEDSSWDAIWQSAGHVNEEGYVVEMSIPYTSLRFQRGTGEQVWGLDLVRIYPRDQRYTLASSRRDRNVSCYLCQVSKIVGFDGANPGKNLEITPTLTAGRTETITSFPDGELEGDDDYEPGLTVRWGVTPNLTLSGTANPDFSQVEADVAQLDVNEQFALFFPEKRPFFLEGADFFETNISTLHTRTVADPQWGAKLTGKEGKNAIGAFLAHDESGVANVLLPGSQRSSFETIDEQFDVGVFRYRRDLGKSSAIGAIATTREGDEYHNRVLGFDTLVRPTDADNIRFQLLGSQTRYPLTLLARLASIGIAQPSGDFEDRAFRLNYTHRTKDWGARATYADFGEDFRADLGFVPRVDYTMAIFGGWYTWWMKDESKWSWLEIGGDWDETKDQAGNLLEREVEVWFLGAGPKQSFVIVGPGQRTRVFRFVDFEQDFVNGFFEVSPTRDLYVNLEVGFSDREDFRYEPPTSPGVPGVFPAARQGEEIRLEPNLRYNFGRHLRLDVSHDFRRLRVDQDVPSGGRFRGEAFRANLSELRLVYQFNVRMFVRAIVQHLDLKRDVALYPDCLDADGCSLQPEFRNLFGQFLFSYKLNPQTALFVGYTDNQDALENTGLVRTGRTFFFKLGYAWVM